MGLSLGAVIAIFSGIIFNREKIVGSKNLLPSLSSTLSLYHLVSFSWVGNKSSRNLSIFHGLFINFLKLKICETKKARDVSYECLKLCSVSMGIHLLYRRIHPRAFLHVPNRKDNPV